MKLHNRAHAVAYVLCTFPAYSIIELYKTGVKFISNFLYIDYAELFCLKSCLVYNAQLHIV
jgi:hypothetical protein